MAEDAALRLKFTAVAATELAEATIELTLI
jgi:hypothetical protein